MHKLVNAPVEELARADFLDIRTLVADEPFFTATKLYELAQRQVQHEMQLHGALWDKYNFEREEWLKTYRAALTGLLAAGMAATDAHERAEHCAKLGHGDLPEKPKS